jgi:hypothetical protein
MGVRNGEYAQHPKVPPLSRSPLICQDNTIYQVLFPLITFAGAKPVKGSTRAWGRISYSPILPFERVEKCCFCGARPRACARQELNYVEGINPLVGATIPALQKLERGNAD